MEFSHVQAELNKHLNRAGSALVAVLYKHENAPPGVQMQWIDTLSSELTCFLTNIISRHGCEPKSTSNVKSAKTNTADVEKYKKAQRSMTSARDFWFQQAKQVDKAMHDYLTTTSLDKINNVAIAPSPGFWNASASLPASSSLEGLLSKHVVDVLALSARSIKEASATASDAVNTIVSVKATCEDRVRQLQTEVQALRTSFPSPPFLSRTPSSASSPSADDTDKLRNILVKRDDTIAKLQRDLELQTRQAHEWRQRSAELKRDIESRDRIVTETKRGIQQLNDKVEKTWEQKKQEFSALQLKLQTTELKMDEQSRALERRHDDLEQNKAEFEQALKDAEVKMETSQKEKMDLEDLTAKLRAELDTAQHQLQTVCLQKDEIDVKLHDVLQEMNNVSDVILAKTADILLLEEDREQLNTSLARVRGEAGQLALALQEKEVINVCRLEEMEQLKSQVAMFETQQEALYNSTDDKVQALRETLDGFALTQSNALATWVKMAHDRQSALTQRNAEIVSLQRQLIEMSRDAYSSTLSYAPAMMDEDADVPPPSKKPKVRKRASFSNVSRVRAKLRYKIKQQQV